MLLDTGPCVVHYVEDKYTPSSLVVNLYTTILYCDICLPGKTALNVLENLGQGDGVHHLHYNHLH